MMYVVCCRHVHKQVSSRARLLTAAGGRLGAASQPQRCCQGAGASGVLQPCKHRHPAVVATVLHRHDGQLVLQSHMRSDMTAPRELQGRHSLGQPDRELAVVQNVLKGLEDMGLDDDRDAAQQQSLGKPHAPAPAIRRQAEPARSTCRGQLVSTGPARQEQDVGVLLRISHWAIPPESGQRSACLTLDSGSAAPYPLAPK